jgi:hypothetical protein
MQEKKLMQNTFYNQPVVNWAKQNLAQPVEIKMRFSSRWARILLYLLLFSIPGLIFVGMIFRKLQEKDLSWWGVFLCGGVLMLPGLVIILIGTLTRQKLLKTLDAIGVKSSIGRKFLWENLYYVDHVSKSYRAGNVSRKIADNQLELVFADGKAIIPPLIENREQVWQLINSMPAEVKDDGVIRTGQPGAAGNLQNPAGNMSFDEIAKAMGEMKAQHDRNK